MWERVAHKSGAAPLLTSDDVEIDAVHSASFLQGLERSGERKGFTLSPFLTQCPVRCPSGMFFL